MMSDCLGDTEVQVAHVALGNFVGCGHSRSLDAHLEVDVVAAQVVVLEVGHHCWVLSI